MEPKLRPDSALLNRKNLTSHFQKDEEDFSEMSEELDPALSMAHLKKGADKSKRSGFADQDNESIQDELEPYIRKDGHEDAGHHLSKFKTAQTDEDDEDSDA